MRDADVHLGALAEMLAGAREEERDGLVFAIEQVGEARGAALVRAAECFSRFDTGALDELLAHV